VRRNKNLWESRLEEGERGLGKGLGQEEQEQEQEVEAGVGGPGDRRAPL